MPAVSKIIGFVLILLGVASYLLTGGQSATALIPSFFGLAFVGLGYLAARSEGMRKHAMHAALLLAIFGIAGTFSGLTSVLQAIGGTPLDRPEAAFAQAVMAILCIYFLIRGIRSFIDARRAQPADSSSGESGQG